MRRLLLATACLFVGGMVAAVKVTNAALDRLDAAERNGQVVPHRLPPVRVVVNESLMERMS